MKYKKIPIWWTYPTKPIKSVVRNDTDSNLNCKLPSYALGTLSKGTKGRKYVEIHYPLEKFETTIYLEYKAVTCRFLRFHNCKVPSPLAATATFGSLSLQVTSNNPSFHLEFATSIKFPSGVVRRTYNVPPPGMQIIKNR